MKMYNFKNIKVQIPNAVCEIYKSCKKMVKYILYIFMFDYIGS